MLKLWNHEDITGARGTRQMPWNPPFQMFVYYYLVDGLLIDTGPISLAHEAISFFKMGEIQQVFLTHLHEDHAGMAYWLQQNQQIPIYLHPAAVDQATREPELKPYRLQIWGRRLPFKADPVTDSIVTSRHVFEVIDSPGHCRHHKVLYDRENGWLFSGDILNNISPRSAFYEENMSEMLSSLRNILALDFETVFCAHTGVRLNGRQLFQKKLDYLLEVQQKVTHLRREMNDTEICQQLFPGSDSMAQLTGGDFSPYYIISTL